MDSQLGFGCYQRYKEDTTLFLEWLARNAAASGYTLPSKKAFPTAASVSVSVPVSVDSPSSDSESKSYAEKL